MKISIPFLIALTVAPGPVSAATLLEKELSGFSMLAGERANPGADAKTNGNARALPHAWGHAGDLKKGDAEGVKGDDDAKALEMVRASSQFATAKSALMKGAAPNARLAATKADDTKLEPGVHRPRAQIMEAGARLTLDGKGPAELSWAFNAPTDLVAREEADMKPINGGVRWDSRSYAPLDAKAIFIGDILLRDDIGQAASVKGVEDGRDAKRTKERLDAKGMENPLDAKDMKDGLDAGGMEDRLYVDGLRDRLDTKGMEDDLDTKGLRDRLEIKGVEGSLDIVDRAAVQSLMQAVPEPQTWALMVLGVGLLGAGIRRDKRVKRAVMLTATE